MAVGICGILMMAAAGVSPATSAVAAGSRAHQARVISVHDSSELHLVHAVGNTLIEEGRVTGTLPGNARIRLNIDVATGTATSRFTIYTRAGSLSGYARGEAHPGRGGWESFSGRTRLEHGTGRYAHASGTGTMYGALYRRNDRLIVQTFGRLRY
jgi:hypothetical protein